MALFTEEDIVRAGERVYRSMPPTAQYRWPQLCDLLGLDVWIKHENHTPTGAFKVRGGITFIDWLKKQHPEVGGVITATRGNHGQSQARAAIAAGLSATILVPRGNSVEKNAAMRAFGAQVIEAGDDFDAARLAAARLAEERQLFMVPPFHIELVRGVATYAYELFTAIPRLDRVYVPIGCGSGICGLIAVRDMLGLDTEIVGVVSTAADGAKRSFETGTLTETATAATFADGMAVRVPVAEAYAIYAAGAADVVAVSDDAVAEAMRILFRDTHNVAEGAGAAAFAAVMQDAARLRNKRVAAILTGGNVDTAVFAEVLRGGTPLPG
ncbi:MAG: threonine dehydratase [Gammaproteobacteria bacterium]|nr:threonine dehydratase [Gammaproteobacteria bacterium]